MMQVWLEHDSDWIYPDGPTGKISQRLLQQIRAFVSPPPFLTNFVLNVGPDMQYWGGVVLNEPVFHVNYGRLFSSE